MEKMEKITTREQNWKRYVDELSQKTKMKVNSLAELKIKGLLVYREWYQGNLRGYDVIGRMICRRFKMDGKEVKGILAQEKRKYHKRNYRKKLKDKIVIESKGGIKNK